MFFKEKECLRISIPVKNVESFLRLSNLHRHQRSTHISNSFRCQKCRKCFTRQDIYLLQYTKKGLNKTILSPFDNKCIFMRMTSSPWRTLMMFVILVMYT